MLDMAASQLPPVIPSHVRASSRPPSEPRLQMVWTRASGRAGRTQLVCRWVVDRVPENPHHTLTETNE
jgi:hypothetical protein